MYFCKLNDTLSTGNILSSSRLLFSVHYQRYAWYATNIVYNEFVLPSDALHCDDELADVLNCSICCWMTHMSCGTGVLTLLCAIHLMLGDIHIQPVVCPLLSFSAQLDNCVLFATGTVGESRFANWVRKVSCLSINCSNKILDLLSWHSATVETVVVEHTRRCCFIHIYIVIQIFNTNYWCGYSSVYKDLPVWTS